MNSTLPFLALAARLVEAADAAQGDRVLRPDAPPTEAEMARMAALAGEG